MKLSRTPDLRFALLYNLLAGVTLSCLWVAPAFADASPLPEQPIAPPSDQVDLTSNTVSYDETGQILTAEGEVEIIQLNKILRADKVVYNIATDKVHAYGHVVFLEPSGNIHFADEVELEEEMKNGFVKKLRSVLADGSRLNAAEGQRIDGTKIILKEATYTPCDPCKANPEKPPVWQIRADQVTHDETDHSVSYDDARFEFYGVPVAYTPYFSHSDGTIKQKDGFLPPRFSLDSQLGFGASSGYYWGISPSEDATLGAKVFSKENPQLFGQYRKRFDDAETQLDASLTHTDADGAQGHIFGEGLWDIDEKWRAGFNGQLTTDDTYLRKYNITSEDVLENELYAERFDNRDYFTARALAYQDIRVSDRSADQPNILPEISSHFMGDPNALLGGRWEIGLSSLNLLRKGNGQDVFRGSADISWERRDEVPIGLVNTLTLDSRGDYYEISDRDENSIVGGSGGTRAFRFYPVLNDVVSYPVAKNMDGAQVVIAPTASLTLSPKVKNDTNIPNEDSQDVQIDASNIFEANRFPGIDRVEDGNHATYGARTGVYLNDGSKGEVFLGQSYRFDKEDNPFPDGSGLSTQKSDVVGQIVGNYQDLYSLDYRFQLASTNLQSERHEIDGMATIGKAHLTGTYLYARALEGTDLDVSREQVQGSLSYDITPEWMVSTGVRYDLSEDQKGLRYTDVGLIYAGQCMGFSTHARRSFTDDDTGDSATEVTFQIDFKNLGSFGNQD